MTVCLFICVGFYLAKGMVAAYSSLLGGILFALPQWYFGYRTFQASGARSTQAVVMNLYRGEATKFIVIAVGFALVFKFVRPVDYAALYFTFISVLVLNCCSPLLIDKMRQRANAE